MRVLEGMDEVLIDGRTTEGLLILEFRRQIDTVVLTDVMDGQRWQFLGLGRDAHRIENMLTGLQIAGKGSGRDFGELGQGAFADKTMGVVEINHKIVNSEK